MCGFHVCKQRWTQVKQICKILTWISIAVVVSRVRASPLKQTSMMTSTPSWLSAQTIAAPCAIMNIRNLWLSNTISKMSTLIARKAYWMTLWSITFTKCVKWMHNVPNLSSNDMSLAGGCYGLILTSPSSDVRYANSNSGVVFEGLCNVVTLY